MKFLKNHIQNPSISTWGVFGAFFITLFLMNVLFHYYAFGTILISSLWKQPFVFFEFYGIKLFIVTAIASLVFLFKRIEWTWGFVILFNVWIEANLLYFRQSGFFIDTYALMMAFNLKGYTSAASIYWLSRDWIFIVLTIGYILSSFFLNRKREDKRYPLMTLIIIILSIGLHTCLRYGQEQRLLNGEREFQWNIFLHETRDKTYLQLLLINEHSILHAFFFDIIDLTVIKQESYELSKQEYDNICSVVGEYGEKSSQANRSLIIVLIESFENWVLTEDIMPNLYTFTHSDHVFYAPQVKSQIKQGNSSDGQLIITTGVLPINEGATVFRFSHDTFPSFCQWYEKSIMINPCGEIWNQKRMTDAYHYTDYMAWKEELDHVVMDTAISYFQSQERPLSMLIITSSTHAPFVVERRAWDFNVPDDMPTDMQHYIQSFHYLDESIQPLLEHIYKDSLYANSVVVFVADHKVFGDESRTEFQEYADSKGMELQPIIPFTPLIIYSPTISGNILYADTCYQMDVFPTMQGLVMDKIEDGMYRGVGIDLLSNESRALSEEDAYAISNQIIRSNFFAGIK